MIGVGLLIPLAAGLLPVWQGTRISTYAALNDAGIHAGAAAQRLVERLLARLPRRWLQRPLLLAVRNTLRHKGRLLRTMIVLILGTALFIGVISVRQSVDTTQADFLRYHHYDVQVQFEQPQRMARLASAAFELPDVVAVEGWGLGSAKRLRPDGSESNQLPGLRAARGDQDGGSGRAGRALAAAGRPLCGGDQRHSGRRRKRHRAWAT